VYVGGTFDLKKRFELSREFNSANCIVGVSIDEEPGAAYRNSRALHEKQSDFISRLRPRMNSKCWHTREETHSSGV
jgi:hypothetical protein